MSYSKTKVRRNRVHFIDPQVLAIIRENPEAFISSWSKGKRAIFKQLLYWVDRFPEVKMSQGRIAKACGLSRKHVNKMFAEFEQEGILALWYRHKMTSVYKLSSFFTPEIRGKICHLFGALPLALLISFSAVAADKIEMLHKIKRDIFISKSLSNPESLNGRARDESDQEKIKKELKREQQSRSMKTYELKSIKLTENGQIRLQDIPEEVIYEIDNRIHRMKNQPTKPWNYFYASCTKHCKEKGIALDFTYSRHLAVKHGVPDEGPFIDESFVPVPPVHIPVRKTYNKYQPQENYAPVKELSYAEKMKSQWKDERVGIDREKELRGAEQELSSLAATNPFAAILMRGIKDLSEEKTVEKPLESDKKATENIMSKNPNPFKALLESITESARPVNIHDEVGEDIGNEEAYDEFDDPFGDRL